MLMKPAALGIFVDSGLTQQSARPFWSAGFTRLWRGGVIMDKTNELMQQAATLGNLGSLARTAGDESGAERHFRDAFALAMKGVNGMRHEEHHSVRLGALQAAARFALECGEADAARRLIKQARAADGFEEHAQEWEPFLNVSAWRDAWLIAAVRHEPPDEPALDALADRHWRQLFARCQMLTLNPEKAGDLAQQAWVRVLRVRQTLKPGGNFPAYISTVAANLWRDNHRSAKRAGPLADDRLASLDAAYLAGEEDGAALGEMVADLNALQADEQNRLAQDIDDALAHLSPLLRDVVVSRLIYGESCLEIGRRYSRTQQTVSAWVRQGIREIKEYLERPDSAGNSQERP